MSFDLSDIPRRMRRLTLDEAGRPVPRFVQWIDGKPDFRVMSHEHMAAAIKHRL